MKSHTRRGIAYIAGRLISGTYSTTLRDDSESKHFSFAGEVSLENGVSVYDYEQKCYIRGNSSGESFSFYHDGNSQYIELTINENTFKGYDRDSGTFFSGTVDGDFITIRDDEYQQEFKYLL